MPSRAYAESVSGRRSKWVVLGLWVVGFLVASPYSAQLSDVVKDEASAYLPGSAESTRVLEEQKQFPQGQVSPAVIVYERAGGLTPEDLRLADVDAAEIRTSQLADDEIPPPVPSDDGEAVLLAVPLDGERDAEEIAERVDAMRLAIAGAPEGLRVYLTGPAGLNTDFVEQFQRVDGTLLLATVLVVAFILLLTYRSPVLWMVPLLTVAIGFICASAAVYGFAANDIFIVNGQSQAILTVLTFGAATDYALLLVARYREELRRHEDQHEAMAVALHRAGPAIVASAATVVLSLLCLLASELASNRGLGPVGALGVMGALLAMLTLLPAVLVIVGRRIFWPFIPRFGTEHEAHAGIWSRVGSAISRRPRFSWVAIVTVLAGLCIGLFSLNTGGLTNEEAFTNEPDSIKGQRILAAHYPAGSASPAYVIADAADAPEVRREALAIAGVAGAGPATASGDRVQLPVTLEDPPDDRDAWATVDALRHELDSVAADALVGGDAAVNYDVARAADHDEGLVIPIVLVVVLVVLGLLLRAVLAPLVLLFTVVLSFGAALGVSGLVFDHLFGFAGADISLPLFAFIFLVALGIDYNIFLMSRVREEAARIGTRDGTLLGLAVTGGVITSAGIVLAATFSVLMVLPVVAIIEVGFAVAFGVLLDTFIVRCLLVPALVLDIGPRVWWPHPLSRR